MVLNNFFINILVRVMLIVITCVIFGIIIQYLGRGYYYNLTGIIFLIILQTWLLINYVNKTNADLEKFLSSVQDHDSSIRFGGSIHDGSFGKLYERMNQLNTTVRNVQIANKQTGHFLQSLVDHIDIGLVSFDQNGKIEIFNRAATRYLAAGTRPHNVSSIEKNNVEIFRILNTIRPGHEVLHKLSIDGLQQSVLIKAAGFNFDQSIIKLVSFQDITSELNKKELDSWQKLIRVLTHEIMNSISPVTSLASVISGYFRKKDHQPVPPESIDEHIISKTLSGLETIEETGKGLLGFVDQFRSLTSIPKPDYSTFSVQKLFEKCKILMETVISKRIKISTHVYPEDIVLSADHAQIEQVLINLIKNAADALPAKKGGVIQLNAFQNERFTIIQVSDNGPGIPEGIIDDIFVPFYTTKKNGSGIGLSLSKQIMQNHAGTISVNAEADQGATFTLKFDHSRL